MYNHVYRFRRDNPYNDSDLKVLLIGDVVCAKDYSLKKHTHNQIEFCLVTKGRGAFYIGDQPYNVGTGDIFISLPGQIHNAKSDPIDPYRFFYLMFEVNTKGSLAEIYNELLTTKKNIVRDRYDMNRFFSLAINEIMGNMPASETMLGSLLKSITILLHRNLCSDFESMQTIFNSKYELVQQAVQFIDSNIHKKTDLCTISHEIGCSYTYLSRIFKEQIGITITDYCIQHKMERALYLLSYKPDLSITSISAQLGYNDIHYFSKLFKSNFGKSPSQYRNSKR